MSCNEGQTKYREQRAQDGELTMPPAKQSRTCPYCNTVFEPTNTSQRYCCERCTRKAWAARRPSRATTTKVFPPKPCSECGKVFVPTKPYIFCCSEECSRARTRRRDRESYARRNSADYTPKEPQASALKAWSLSDCPYASGKVTMINGAVCIDDTRVPDPEWGF